jgi:hypothetical protein
VVFVTGGTSECVDSTHLLGAVGKLVDHTKYKPVITHKAEALEIIISQWYGMKIPVE